MDSSAIREAQASWERIASASGRGARPVDDLEELDEWWWDAGKEAAVQFWGMCEDHALEARLSHFVNQFGMHGPDADYRWLLANPDILTERIVPTAPFLKDRERGRIGLNRVREAIAEAQVRRFLENPKVLDRFYHAVLASKLFFGTEADHGLRMSGAIDRTVGGFEDEGAYWTNARNFILLAHATSRDDLWRGAPPEELHERCTKWVRWLSENHLARHMRVDPQRLVWYFDPDLELPDEDVPGLPVPQVPLPDWEGPRPPRLIFAWSQIIDHPDVMRAVSNAIDRVTPTSE